MMISVTQTILLMIRVNLGEDAPALRLESEAGVTLKDSATGSKSKRWGQLIDVSAGNYLIRAPGGRSTWKQPWSTLTTQASSAPTVTVTVLPATGMSPEIPQATCRSELPLADCLMNQLPFEFRQVARSTLPSPS